MWYDAAMLAVLAYTTFRGSVKGMAWQVAAIAALVLCFAFAAPLSLVVAPAIGLDPPLNRWVAMLGIYLAFSFGCFAVARMLRSWLEALKFEEYDRHLGALFGFVKGATIGLVLTFFTVCLSETACRYVMQTRSGRLAGEALDHLAVVMPAELAAVLGPHLRHFDEGHHDGVGEVAAGRLADESGEPQRDGFRGSARTERDGDDDDGMFDDALDSLGGKFKRGVRDFVADALSGDRESSDSGAGADHERGSDRAESGTDTEESSAAIDDRLDALTGLLASRPDERSRRRTEIETLLHGIPTAAAANSLQDWLADLRGNPDDPDSETDVTTPLDVRLIRQLHFLAIGEDELPRPVRERLRETIGE